ncbi:MAG: aminotransferase class V-fold PLP-dependent enzyme, partial [Bacteroidales bacterium]|nr:aminotransferase class V-fold PLP-dependent enzyme [Bacteroidales bacterium]
MDSLDVKALRSDFPILERTIYNKPLVYFDNVATTQVPRCVVEAIDDLYFKHKANVHRGVHCLSQEATASMESTRRRVQSFINAESIEEIIFVRGTTEAINLVASSYGQLLEPGDEVILSVMEHHSNIVPWQLLAQRKGIVIKVIPMDDRGVLDQEAYRALFTERTRMVSVCHVSNVLGT